ncbi:MAG: ParB/RepB/Spo0J family partition protein [Tannerella sp.]|jgi:ParB family chromosome partitioning protein|nr:ParB/RepB/Spo0J family partition protein [Tannerella sp.]
MAKTNNRLGRGLDVLLTRDEPVTGGSSSINEIELNRIDPNPDQPRANFDDGALEELAASIRTYGIIQPITLKETNGGRYLIIAGERRYRAAQKVGLERLPAYIKTAADEEISEIALIENIQREDLNAIEISLAYQHLIETNGYTQEQLSERIGKKRATITNYLRLLNLPAEIQMGLKNKQIDMGHARALIPIEDPEVQLALYEQILAGGLSVRNVEELVRNGETKDNTPETLQKKERKPLLPDEYKVLNDRLSDFFQLKVKLSYDTKKGNGKITIPFRSETELEQVMALMDRMKQQ